MFRTFNSSTKEVEITISKSDLIFNAIDIYKKYGA